MPSRAVVSASRVHRFSSAVTSGSRRCHRAAAATRLASRSWAGWSSRTRTAPSATASCCIPASRPAGMGSAANGPRWVCRCGTAASIFHSAALSGTARPSHSRASRSGSAGSGSSSSTGTWPSCRAPQPQPEQGSAAADQHLPADRVHRPQPPAAVGMDLQSATRDPEPPGLGVVHRRSPRRRRDQEAGLLISDGDAASRWIS